MRLQDTLEEFRQYLLLNFEKMKELLSDDLLADWLQVSWEIVVESRLLETNTISGFLDVYGDGSDCNGASSRVTVPNALPKCAVHIKQGFVLHSFGTIRDGNFVQSPPFNYVKGENSKSEVIVKVSEAQFTIGAAYDCVANH